MNTQKCNVGGQVVRLLLNSKEAAQALSISPRTLWTLTKTGQIAYVQSGRSVRYDVEDLQKWIERNKTKATIRAPGNSMEPNDGQHF
jgi:excisionase family DNA binding protein